MNEKALTREESSKLEMSDPTYTYNLSSQVQGAIRRIFEADGMDEEEAIRLAVIGAEAATHALAATFSSVGIARLDVRDAMGENLLRHIRLEQSERFNPARREERLMRGQ